MNILRDVFHIYSDSFHNTDRDVKYKILQQLFFLISNDIIKVKVYSKEEYKELTDGLNDDELLDITCKMRTGIHFATPVFDGALESEIRDMLVESGVDECVHAGFV